MGIYYTLDKIDAKNKLFNYVITARGCGKTIAIKKRMIDQALKGKTFVYVRRRSVELKTRAMDDFFWKLQKIGIHADKDLKYEGGIFYMGDKVIGEAVALSTSHNTRSIDYRDVSDIYFEEFVIKRSPNLDYLDGEVEKFLDLYSTVARDADVKAWFLGNRIHDFNPYFLYFDLIPPKDGIKVRGDHAIEIWTSQAFVDNKNSTRFGKLIAGTNYGNHAVLNDTLDESKSFISKVSKRGVIFLKIYHMGKWYDCYKDVNTHKVFVKSGSVNTQNAGYRPLLITTDTLYENDKILGIRDAKNARDARMMDYDKALRTNRIYYTDTKVQEVCRVINKKIYFD